MASKELKIEWICKNTKCAADTGEYIRVFISYFRATLTPHRNKGIYRAEVSKSLKSVQHFQ